MDPERSGSFSGGVFLCPKEARGVLTGNKTFKEKMHKNNKIIGIKKTKKVKETELLLQ